MKNVKKIRLRVDKSEPVDAKRSVRTKVKSKTKIKKKSPPILIKLATAEDEATGLAYEVYQLLQANGSYVTCEVGREIACEENQLRKELNKRASLLPRNKKEAIPIIKAATAEKPKEQWLYARHLGWRPEMKQLVTACEVIGADDGEVKLMVPKNLTRAQRGVLKKAGTKKGWKRLIALAKYSSCAILMLAIACAAPLLRFMGMPCFVVCIHGGSKIGKSAALLLASSIMGIGKEKELPNLNTTVAAFQEKARMFSGLLVPANETALLKIIRKNTSEQLTELIYTFAEGVEIARHSKSTYAAPEGAADWEGILVMTSETSLTAFSAIAGIERRGGETARAIDVPALLSKTPTIFGRFPEDLPKKDRDEWARTALKTIREGCAEHHGLMLKPYVEYLIAKGDKVKEETDAYMQEFRAELDLEGASEATLHAALCCSLIYAGGMHGIEAGILPIAKWRLKKAMLACCAQALKVSEQAMSLTERARATIIAKLKEAFPKGKPNPELEGKVHRRKHADGRTTFAVRSEEFKRWFASQPELFAALRWLYEKKLLKTVKGAKPTPGSISWAVSFPKIDGAGQRCIVFDDPRKLDA